MITHFISSMAVLFLSAGLQSIRGDVCTLLKVSTSANKLPGSERSSLETNGAHFTGRPLQPLWFVSLLMGAEVPGPQAICFLECQSEREQPASLNSLKKKKKSSAPSEFLTDWASRRLSLYLSSLPYTGSTDRISNAHRVLNAPQRWLLKLSNWPPRQSHMEATWVIDRGHGEKEIPSGRLDCPGSF